MQKLGVPLRFRTPGQPAPPFRHPNPWLLDLNLPLRLSFSATASYVFRTGGPMKVPGLLMSDDLTDRTSVQPAPQVMCRELDGEAVLLHLESGHYYGLDEVGLSVWNLLAEGKDLGAVLNRLVETYETTSEEAWKDLIRLIAELEEQGLVRIVPATSGRE